MAAIQGAGLTYAPDPATEVGVSGDLAWETGTFTVTAKDGSVVDRGKFSSVIARRDGVWKLIRDTYNSDAPPAAADGKTLRIVRFTSASAEAQQAAIKLVDDEIDALYAGATGFQWVKYYTNPKTLETGSVSLWASAADIDAFLKSEGYQPIPAKLKPLMKGPMVSQMVEVHAPPKK
jgi:quinol monooxygenase YgiN